MNMKIETHKYMAGNRIVKSHELVVITTKGGRTLSSQTPAEFEALEHSPEVLALYEIRKRRIRKAVNDE